MSLFSWPASQDSRAEDELPLALYAAASVAGSSDFQLVLGELSEAPGVVGREFALCLNRVKHGASVEKSLKQVGELSGSRALKRVASVLLSCYNTGADLPRVLIDLADDAALVLESEREEQSMTALERYTVLAGCLLVPLVLGLTLKVASGLDFAGFQELGLTTNAVDAGELQDAFYTGGFVYCSFYAGLAAFFSARLERKNLRAAFKRFVLLAVFSVSVFMLAAGVL